MYWASFPQLRQLLPWGPGSPFPVPAGFPLRALPRTVPLSVSGAGNTGAEAFWQPLTRTRGTRENTTDAISVITRPPTSRRRRGDPEDGVPTGHGHHRTEVAQCRHEAQGSGRRDPLQDDLTKPLKIPKMGDALPHVQLAISPAVPTSVTMFPEGV